MKQLGEKLPPGGAALIVLVRNVTMDKLLGEVKIPGEVIQSSLSNDAEDAAAQCPGASRVEHSPNTRPVTAPFTKGVASRCSPHGSARGTNGRSTNSPPRRTDTAVPSGISCQAPGRSANGSGDDYAVALA